MSAPRIVLDTNVCLDLFVFGDPRVAGLRDALQSGAVEAVTNAACRDEWLRVLAYPQLKLDEVAQAAALAAFDALLRPFDGAPVSDVRLPRCADRDDQKFLELAHAAGARWLLSRDDALLVLTARAKRDGLFEIMQPQDWSLPPP